MTSPTRSAGIRHASRRDFLSGAGLALMGGALGGLARVARAAEPAQIRSSMCPMQFKLRSGNLYYYLASVCPYPDGAYYGMALPILLNPSQLGCNSSQCNPFGGGSRTSAMAPASAPTPARIVPTKLPPVPGKCDPVPLGGDVACRYGGLFWGSYPDGTPLSQGLREIPKPEVPTYDERLVRGVTYRFGTAEVDGGVRGFLVVSFEMSVACDPAGPVVVRVGHEVLPFREDWPRGRAEPLTGRVYRVWLEGEWTEVLFGQVDDRKSR